MTDSFCGYPGDRDQVLVACVYEDGGEAGERALFEEHLATCARCRDELAALRGVRAQLARWAPPEPAFSVIDGSGQSARRDPATPSWREIPAWAQVAAALLFLGVSAGIANLDVRYDANGLNVRTGCMPPAADLARQPHGGGLAADGRRPVACRLTALERQLKTNSAPCRRVTVTDGAHRATDCPLDEPEADVLLRVRAIVDESEKRQQRELRCVSPR